MLVLLKRGFFWGGTLYEKSQSGTVVPDDAELPSDARVWDGGEFAEVPKDEKERVAFMKDAARAEAPKTGFDGKFVLPSNPKYKAPPGPIEVDAKAMASAGLVTERSAAVVAEAADEAAEAGRRAEAHAAKVRADAKSKS